MPPLKAPPVALEAPPVAEKTATVSQTIGGIEASLDALLDTLKLNDVARTQVASGDLTSLSVTDTLKVCAWYADSCGLHSSEVCAMKLKDGRTIPYVKASGVLRYARGKFKVIDRDNPDFVNAGRTVLVRATVEMSDGSKVTDFACRDGTDARSIMACSTAATVRVLRIACGIPIPSEGEVS